MNVLVVNLGSTSFKYRLFDMPDERVLARGGVEGVGASASRVYHRFGEADPFEQRCPIANQAEAVEACVGRLTEDATTPVIDAVGFKAVHGGPISEPVRVTPEVIKVMESFAAVVPAHNPPYVAAMKAFAARMPEAPQVAAFETGFHQTIPAARRHYAVPYEWAEAYGVKRYGFHGASHRYVAVRTAELLGRDDLRVISCHLGGSSSICAIESGRSVANSFGTAPQSGIPSNNRVGDFDPYALLLVRARTGASLDEMLSDLATRAGLLGISGVSNDMQEIIAAAEAGHGRAGLALDIFVEHVRHYIGAYAVALGAVDVLVFTGGMGERSAEIRRRVCSGLGLLGIRLDAPRNLAGGAEATISTDDSPVRILALRTNEELIVARQTAEVLSG
ncbi:MAG: acetate/propionate family kinase [bacterium]|nr:acetate/propionate family kinase [bacterium]